MTRQPGESSMSTGPSTLCGAPHGNAAESGIAKARHAGALESAESPATSQPRRGRQQAIVSRRGPGGGGAGKQAIGEVGQRWRETWGSVERAVGLAPASVGLVL